MIKKLIKIVPALALIGFSVSASALTIVNNVAFPKELQGDSNTEMIVNVMDESPNSNNNLVQLHAPFSSQTDHDLSYMHSITILSPDIIDHDHPGRAALDVTESCIMLENVPNSATFVLTGKVDPDNTLADVVIDVSCQLL